MFGGVFERTSVRVYGRERVRGEWGEMIGIRCCNGCFPFVCFEDTIDVALTGNFYVTGVLSNVKDIEIVNKAKIFEGGVSFVRKLKAFANDVINVGRVFRASVLHFREVPGDACCSRGVHSSARMLTLLASYWIV